MEGQNTSPTSLRTWTSTPAYVFWIFCLQNENVSENVSETNQCEKNVMEVHLSHSSFSNGNAKDEKDGDTGGTIQYLAQENVKLVQINKQLTCEVEKLKRELEELSTG